MDFNEFLGNYCSKPPERLPGKCWLQCRGVSDLTISVVREMCRKKEVGLYTLYDMILIDIYDDDDCWYERFVLEYYRHHHKELTVNASQVKWNLSDDTEEIAIKYLPVMQTDIMLKQGKRALIIDTKYYTHIMQQQKQFDSYSFHSGNLYQIFTYVKNEDAAGTGNVSGMLLYARTGEPITPDASFMMGGNQISIKTLDLNRNFSFIAQQLDEIVTEHFKQLKT